MYVNLSCVPYNEEEVQVGDPDYARKARIQCNLYIKLLRQIFGEEPVSASFRITSNPHDFGTYYDLRCEFDERYEAAKEYAYNVEKNEPDVWPDEFKTELEELFKPFESKERRKR